MRKSITIGILGSDGQVGQTFKALAKDYPAFSFMFYSREAADITTIDSLKSLVMLDKPDYMINCAAYTAVDKAESDAETCFKINVEGCQNLIKALEGTDTKVIHYSSDYVYHTFDGFPILEDVTPEPKSVYATTKLQADQILLSSEIPTMIIRTSWVISPFGHNFVKTMLRLGSEKSEISVVNDQYGAPTYTFDLVRATLQIIEQDVSDQFDFKVWNNVYNYANEGVVTWYEMASFIMEKANLNCRVKPISTVEYPTPAQRPLWSVMSKHKIKDNFHVLVPHWRESLAKCVSAILDKKE